MYVFFYEKCNQILLLLALWLMAFGLWPLAYGLWLMAGISCETAFSSAFVFYASDIFF